MGRVVERGCEIGRVIEDAEGECVQRVMLRDVLLRDSLAHGRDADARGPDARELAAECHSGGDRFLLVRLEQLLDGPERELDRLIAMREFRNDVLRTRVVAETGGGR